MQQLDNQMPVAEALAQLFPSESEKWDKWAGKLTDEDIDTVGHVKQLPDIEFDHLPVSAVLKGGLRRIRGQALSVDAIIDSQPDLNAPPGYNERDAQQQLPDKLSMLKQEPQDLEIGKHAAHAVQQQHVPAALEMITVNTDDEEHIIRAVTGNPSGAFSPFPAQVGYPPQQQQYEYMQDPQQHTRQQSSGEKYEASQREKKLTAAYIPPSKKDAAVRFQTDLQKLEDKLQASSWNDKDRSDVRVLIDKTSKFLDKYKKKNDKKSLGVLQAVQATLETKFEGIYTAAKDLIKDEPSWEKVMKLGEKFQKSGDFCQARNVLIPLYEDAHSVKREFDAALSQVSASSGAKFHSSALKHLYRCVEKTVMRSENVGRSDNVYDIVRAMVECESMSQMASSLEALSKHDGLEILRCKNRFAKPSPGGWMDLMVNVRMKADVSRHVCEVQFVHSKMLMIRRDWGGHGDYSKFRSARELLEMHGALKELTPPVKFTPRAKKFSAAACCVIVALIFILLLSLSGSSSNNSSTTTSSTTCTYNGEPC